MVQPSQASDDRTMNQAFAPREPNATRFRAYSGSTYTMPLPEGHRFPMSKYAGVRFLLEQAGLEVLDPPRPSWEQVERVHTHEYLRKLRFGDLEPKELRLLGFPWSEMLVERALRAAGGTLKASLDALEHGLGINLAGGTHHAYPDHGEGFCVLNDVAIAAKDLLEKRLVSRISVCDLDVHQGNGTAAIFANEPGVFTLSVHGARNYPFHKETSSLDIGLAESIGDAEYLEVIEAQVLPAMRAFEPELVYFLAGVDVLERDRFGKFGLSLAGAAERDRRVFRACKQSRVPIVSLMSGGYNREIETTIQAHANTVLSALQVFDAHGFQPRIR
jgi:acetoin utilization deacetylase AcuC-like enzyme